MPVLQAYHLCGSLNSFCLPRLGGYYTEEQGGDTAYHREVI